MSESGEDHVSRDWKAPPQTFRLAKSTIGFVVFAVLLYGVFCTMVVVKILQEEFETSAAIIVLAWLSLSALQLGSLVARTPHRVVIHEDKIVDFVRLIGSKRIPAADITSIAPRRWGFNRFAVVRHRGGKIELATALDDFHEFLGTLKALNPHLTIDRF